VRTTGQRGPEAAGAATIATATTANIKIKDAPKRANADPAPPPRAISRPVRSWAAVPSGGTLCHMPVP
jgi:hypothetical protein